MYEQFGKPEDACPECNQAEANQLREDGEITLYICPSCGHEWQPPSKMEIGWKVITKVPEVGVSEADIEKAAQEIHQEMRHHLDMMVSRAFTPASKSPLDGGEEDG